MVGGCRLLHHDVVAVGSKTPHWVVARKEGKTMKNFLVVVNWWSVTAVMFLVIMVGMLLAPDWAAEYAYGAGFVAVVCAIFATASGSLPGNRR
jgi:hypothetical protein